MNKEKQEFLNTLGIDLNKLEKNFVIVREFNEVYEQYVEECIEKEIPLCNLETFFCDSKYRNKEFYQRDFIKKFVDKHNISIAQLWAMITLHKLAKDAYTMQLDDNYKDLLKDCNKKLHRF